MSDLPSESSFNGGFPPDEDMVVKDEGLIVRTAFWTRVTQTSSFSHAMKILW